MHPRCRAPLTHHSPQLPSRLPSTHTPWSGRGSWRPGGARHCTNDLDALLAAFTGLRFGELASLRRRDVDTENAALMVRRSQAEMQTGALFDKAPKSDAGVRPVAFPAELLPDVKQHLDGFAGAGRDGHVFLGPQGGRLRRSNFRDDWINARTKAKVAADVHFPDLRHTGNTLAASGASLRELMTRMGHSTPRAALIYQHVVSGRDREIADRLGSMIRKKRGDDDVAS
ncbi:tyrosine-type recombinase/integrase [Streptomyces chartreusis]|uniref:tyrosine-type recombinase/integrase n=1 Tax=Streptomyces chartreusis TaxID=1969 RepID=UPI0035D7F337